MGYFENSLLDHSRTFDSLLNLKDELVAVADESCNALRNGNKLMFGGNGGSAADAQHIAAEFTGRFINDREPLAALALTTDTSALTCIGNDYGFDQIFTRQIRALGKVGDLLFLISTSGQSRNIVYAREIASNMGIKTVALTGKRGQTFAEDCDYGLVVDCQITARIQEAHIFLFHVLCGLIEQGLGHG